MTEILFDYELSDSERKQLEKEFPKHKFFFESQKKLSPSIEIYFGNNLPILPKESQLKWVDVPNPSLQNLPLDALKKQSIMITFTKEQNHRQIAEYVFGAILLFAKQFFYWKEVPQEPEEFWNWPLKNSMWTLAGKTLLQIGLGNIGTEILQKAEFFGMKTWGIKNAGGFHPHCKKTFDLGQLHSLLPAIQILSIAVPYSGKKDRIGFHELMLLPKDSIIICVGAISCIDELALAQVASTGKFRGIVLDCFQHPPPQKNSPLWKIPNTIITPQVASYPLFENRVAFMEFRKKLRMYSAGKFTSMLPIEVDDPFDPLLATN